MLAALAAVVAPIMALELARPQHPAAGLVATAARVKALDHEKASRLLAGAKVPPSHMYHGHAHALCIYRHPTTLFHSTIKLIIHPHQRASWASSSKCGESDQVTVGRAGSCQSHRTGEARYKPLATNMYALKATNSRSWSHAQTLLQPVRHYGVQDFSTKSSDFGKTM